MPFSVNEKAHVQARCGKRVSLSCVGFLAVFVSIMLRLSSLR